MSGTEEYYFKKRWIGLANLARVVGNAQNSNTQSSIELSLGDRFQDLEQVIVALLACSSSIRDALLDNSLSADTFFHEINVLRDRATQASAALDDGLRSVLLMRDEMVKSLVNENTAASLKSQAEDDHSA